MGESMKRLRGLSNICVVSCLISLFLLQPLGINDLINDPFPSIRPSIDNPLNCDCIQGNSKGTWDLLIPNHDPLYFMIHDGLIRSYRLHIPESYNDQVLTPLVVVLHGGGGRSVTMLRKTNFSVESEKEGFICVYPNGFSRFPLFFRMWNGGYCCGIALDKNVDDVGFIKTLINHLCSQLTIDPQRIYVTGHSNGAIMAYRLGAELSDMIAAIAPVAGSIGGYADEDDPLYVIPEPLYPVSVMAFHGRLDQNVPYNGGQGNKSRRYGSDLSVNESIRFWVTHNKCDPVPETQVSDSGNIILDLYKEGQSNTEVYLYTIVNGGHGWPGSDTGDRPTQEISATELIWDFFTQHPKE
jgi:polyhydroxybutyrate depolymerase